MLIKIRGQELVQVLQSTLPTLWNILQKAFVMVTFLKFGHCSTPMFCQTVNRWPYLW